MSIFVGWVGRREIRGAAGIAAVLFVLATNLTFAQLTPPTVRGVRPIGAAPGERVTLEISGSDLDGASALVFEDPGVKAEVSASADRVTARVALPKDVAPGPLR